MMSMSMTVCRYFHTGRILWSPQAAVAVEKSALAKLRKSTGYSFSKCKEALEKHQNDHKSAETWLRSQAQAHGWEKATKLQGRATAQGLVSILSSPNNAVMVEVNCETDFVARNKKFQSLVQRLTQGCFAFSGKSQQSSGPISKVSLGDEELSNIHTTDSRLVKDEVALSIGEIGENMKARRAVCVTSSGSILLAGYTHPAAPEKEVIQFGKFGAIVAYKVTDDSTEASNKSKAPMLAEVGRQLCQHIVGMNPTEIGSMEAPPPREVKHKEAKVEEKVSSETAASSESEDTYSDVEFQTGVTPEVDETILLNQEFLLDPDLTVREFLIQNSIEVVDFVRFECGEKSE